MPRDGPAAPAKTVAWPCWPCADAGTAPTAVSRPSAAEASWKVRRTVAPVMSAWATSALFVRDGPFPVRAAARPARLGRNRSHVAPVGAFGEVLQALGPWVVVTGHPDGGRVALVRARVHDHGHMGRRGVGTPEVECMGEVARAAVARRECAQSEPPVDELHDRRVVVDAVVHMAAPGER